MALSREMRNTAVLVVCQALFMTTQLMIFIVNGLVGYALLGTDKALATLPVSAAVVGVAVATIPASLLMKRIGRRAGFMVGTGVGVVGCLIGASAIFIQSFWLFVLGASVVGCAAGFALYYRFAAADTASPAFKSKAISLVLAGGIFAAVAGPEFAQSTIGLVEGVPFVGTFIAAIAVMLSAMVVLAFLDIPKPDADEAADPGRPLREIARQPAFLVAVFSGMVAYGIMSLAMTATPLAMTARGFTIGDAAFVIQWHVLAMFAPAFFTGALIQRFGVLTIMSCGWLIFLIYAAAALAGVHITNFWVALTALGLGWNFTFVGASTLLTECHRPAEKAKVQGINDFAVFGTHAMASLSSGALLHYLSWNAIHVVAIPVVMTAAAATVWLMLNRRPPAKAAAAADLDPGMLS